jgi:hypothetical protein
MFAHHLKQRDERLVHGRAYRSARHRLRGLFAWERAELARLVLARLGRLERRALGQFFVLRLFVLRRFLE